MSGQRGSHTVYFGDLDKTVTFELLNSRLKEIDGLTGLKVDSSKNKRNTKYAFASFSSIKAGEAAIKRFNHTMLSGSAMRVMWARPYNTENNQGPANIFVKGIPKSFKSNDFGELFALFGAVTSFKLSLNKSGESHGYGYVQFENENHAKMACITMDHHRVEGNLLRCEPFRARADRKGLFNLKVSGFRDWDDERLKSAFAGCGEVGSARVFHRPEGPDFGFVSFAEEKAALEAVRLSGQEVEGQVVTVVRSYNRVDRKMHLYRLQSNPDSITNLYVKNFPKSTTEEEFGQLFARYGELRNHKIAREAGVSRGFGFINFKRHEDAVKAVAELHGSDNLTTGGKRLYVSFFKYRCDRVVRPAGPPHELRPVTMPRAEMDRRMPPDAERRFYQSRHLLPQMVRPGPHSYPGFIPHGLDIRAKLMSLLRPRIRVPYSDDELARALDFSSDRLVDFVDVNKLVDYVRSEIPS